MRKGNREAIQDAPHEETEKEKDTRKCQKGPNGRYVAVRWL